MVVTRSLLGTQFLANRRGFFTWFTLPTMLLRNAIHRTSGGSLSSFSCLQLPNYCWSYLPYSESLFINGFAGRSTPFICTGLTLAVLSIVMILYGSFVGRTRFEVKEVTYTSPRLPQAFDGYRIVQFTDLPIGSWQGNTPAILEVSGFSECPATRPDCFHRRSGKSPGCRAE